MRLSAEPTGEFFISGEVMVRLWQGTLTLADGSEEPAIALISVVALCGPAEALAEGAAEGLVAIPPPTEEEARRWAERVMSGPRA